ncbi:hypothetical protein VCUG_01879 [Vavraia culicis subsp. floridensis]|uniref:Uncharacterized protein n=1 Tax=Vavraia culicis (isolate floridensis) TaxID=948595 RepID=L2GTL9_VAVCU|nr:uncharacterized protein VCUG_01879 [Vavraia culicis subsp. floridensis]ELA46653.1 hypothetical protein VCUG_01879 [Vavraia culicis subsp. floridensis]
MASHVATLQLKICGLNGRFFDKSLLMDVIFEKWSLQTKIITDVCKPILILRTRLIQVISLHLRLYLGVLALSFTDCILFTQFCSITNLHAAFYRVRFTDKLFRSGQTNLMTAG